MNTVSKVRFSMKNKIPGFLFPEVSFLMKIIVVVLQSPKTYGRGFGLFFTAHCNIYWRNRDNKNCRRGKGPFNLPPGEMNLNIFRNFGKRESEITISKVF
jgi:hypothetical protein